MGSPPFRRIAVAVDGSRFAEAALGYGITVARKFASELVVLTVAPLATYVVATEPWVPTEILAAAGARARSEGVVSVSEVFLEGPVTDEIVGYLEKNPAELLIMGSRGQSAAKRLLLGSTSDAVLHHVACAVLIVRLPAAAPPPSPSPTPPPPAGPAVAGSG